MGVLDHHVGDEAALHVGIRLDALVSEAPINILDELVEKIDHNLEGLGLAIQIGFELELPASTLRASISMATGIPGG